MKIISGPHFNDFRSFFKAEMRKGFVCPSSSFDNVRGKFPIGFMIWDTSVKENFKEINTRVINTSGTEVSNNFYVNDCSDYINDWIKPFRANVAKNQLIGKFPLKGNDFQNQNIIQIVHHKMDYNMEAGQFLINQKNVIYACVYFAVRKCIEADWLNDRDQFLAPSAGCESDLFFQSDCLTFTLFSNNMQCKYGTNHWIPFSEPEISAREKFESNFMGQYIGGKIDKEVSFDLFSKVEKSEQTPIVFGKESSSVFDAGRELWKYYHAQPKCNINASFYDIREHFQGRNDTGKMNNKSKDESYNALIGSLRDQLKKLAAIIEPKVYAYGFLKK